MNGWGEKHGFHFQLKKPGAVLVTLDGPLKLNDGRIVTQTIKKVKVEGKSEGRRVYHVTGEDGTMDSIPEAAVHKLVAPSLHNKVCPLCKKTLKSRRTVTDCGDTLRNVVPDCGNTLRKVPDGHRFYGCESWRKDDPQGSCWFKATMRAAD